MPSFKFSSTLSVSHDRFLRSLNMDGVNAELGPFVRMTAPKDLVEQSILDWPVQKNLFKSWILLFGILPIDRHSFLLTSVNPRTGFSERSSSWINIYWGHKRTVTALGSRCQVTDEIEYKSRIPLIDTLLQPSYRLIFWWRHKQLRKFFGEALL